MCVGAVKLQRQFISWKWCSLAYIVCLIAVTEGEEVSWDVERMNEDDYERKATYFVPDLPCPPQMPNRAQATLPRNLTLKASQTLGGKVGDETRVLVLI